MNSRLDNMSLGLHYTRFATLDDKVLTVYNFY